jgi:hypothetical protein
VQPVAFIRGEIMRVLPLVVLVLVAAPAQAQDEAESLYRAMEKKICATKSLQIDFEGEQVFLKEKGTIKAKVYLGEGNRYRIEGVLEHDGKMESVLIVADGKSFFSKPNNNAPGMTRRVQEGDHDKWRGYVARTGVIVSILALAQPRLSSDDQNEKKEFDLDKAVPVKNFKRVPRKRWARRTRRLSNMTLAWTRTLLSGFPCGSTPKNTCRSNAWLKQPRMESRGSAKLMLRTQWMPRSIPGFSSCQNRLLLAVA